MKATLHHKCHSREICCMGQELSVGREGGEVYDIYTEPGATSSLPRLPPFGLFAIQAFWVDSSQIYKLTTIYEFIFFIYRSNTDKTQTWKPRSYASLKLCPPTHSLVKILEVVAKLKTPCMYVLYFWTPEIFLNAFFKCMIQCRICQQNSFW